MNGRLLSLRAVCDALFPPVDAGEAAGDAADTATASAAAATSADVQLLLRQCGAPDAVLLKARLQQL